MQTPSPRRLDEYRSFLRGLPRPKYEANVFPDKERHNLLNILRPTFKELIGCQQFQLVLFGIVNNFQRINHFQ